uniref:ADP-ribosyl cyclase/cyclic ADP-ribose hydrolase n=1 Tax=Quercus lobata TaxID=97700 RepID=A0A7N2ML65_QUELO
MRSSLVFVGQIPEQALPAISLDCKRIRAYGDDINLLRGEEIEPELLKAVETSRIALVMFSKNYATWDWCLDELVKIMDCKRVLKQRVLPIFYDASQSKVLEQKGNFAEALLYGPKDKVNNWRASLMERMLGTIEVDVLFNSKPIFFLV